MRCRGLLGARSEVVELTMHVERESDERVLDALARQNADDCEFLGRMFLRRAARLRKEAEARAGVLNPNPKAEGDA